MSDTPDNSPVSDEAEILWPTQLDVHKLFSASLQEIRDLATTYRCRVRYNSRFHLIREIIFACLQNQVEVVTEGVVDTCRDGAISLRQPSASFASLPCDAVIAPQLMRKYSIRPGQKLRVKLGSSRHREKLFPVVEVLEIEGVPAAEWQTPTAFDKLTALFPNQRLMLENGRDQLAPRLIDLMAPLGKGQRGLICAPPRGGKTVLLKQIANAICTNHPEVEVLICLLDERPEEVTDFRENVAAQVYASTFDERPKRHAELAEILLERARRLVELGKDVVILVDSLTRMARGYNTLVSGGRTGSGGVGTKALERPRKFFGSARNCEEGGSLTILATCLIETDTKMDEVIFEEFKGTGNMELHLDRESAEKRIFPALDLPKSGTRKDDLLYHAAEFAKVLELRRILAQRPAPEQLELLLFNLSRTQNNAELLLEGPKLH